MIILHEQQGVYQSEGDKVFVKDGCGHRFPLSVIGGSRYSDV